MPTQMPDKQTLMNRLNEAEKTIGITTGLMCPVFDLLCDEIAGKELAGVEFPAVFATTIGQTDDKMQQLQQRAVQYSDEYYRLSTARTYIRFHYKEFIVAIFGDKNNPDCRTAIEKVGNMLRRK